MQRQPDMRRTDLDRDQVRALLSERLEARAATAPVGDPRVNPAHAPPPWPAGNV
jgi:hypothetical protein